MYLPRPQIINLGAFFLKFLFIQVSSGIVSCPFGRHIQSLLLVRISLLEGEVLDFGCFAFPNSLKCSMRTCHRRFFSVLISGRAAFRTRIEIIESIMW